VFYTNDFRGHWPVGTSAVIVARDLDEAYVLMTSQLIAMGLGTDNADFTIKELATDSTRVVVLQDGNY
jgi:hypothetical protein